jgi:ABC-type ATPase with predicted acetyltransferase domain
VKEAEREAEDSGEVDSAEVADSAGKVSVAVDSAAKDSAEAEDSEVKDSEVVDSAAKDSEEVVSAVRVVNRALISDDLLEDFWDDWICFVD